MAASENAALPGGKVGGVGDVVRDLPRALAREGWRSKVLTPEYGLFAGLPGARKTGQLDVAFGGRQLAVDVISIADESDDIEHIVFAHPQFAPQGPKIYCDDGHARPFASDAGKFALFAAATAAYVRNLAEPPDVVHLHDWHAALYCLLRQFDPTAEALQAIPTVYTIHNLALQGIRPLQDDPSSLAAWFPQLAVDADAVVDPRYGDCINPMATAVRLADALNTVSPTYASEILRPNDPERGFRGGEGLEADLAAADANGRLFGILNGCEYPRLDRRRPGWRRLLDTIGGDLYEWIVNHKGPREIHEDSIEHLRALPKRRPRNLLTSIGRLTEQKAQLLLQRNSEGATAIEKILGSHARDTVVMILGSGDPSYEREIAEIATHHKNLLFICGYSEQLSDLLYRTGDLFLMPSSFEPCGISQMLAMRAAQPCVVHAVGGLRDTVQHDVNGFVFDGNSPLEQAENFIDTVSHAIAIKNVDQDLWLKIRGAARNARYRWTDSARQYVDKLYFRKP